MRRSARLCSATVALFLAVSGVAEAAALSVADRAFMPVLQRVDGNLRDFAIVCRRQVSAQLDLVLALGTPHTVQKDDNQWFLWMKDDRLGIFLQDRQNPNLVFSLAIEPGPPCRIHLERVTDQEVLISCPGEYGWGNSAPNQKFVFDINSKALNERYTYSPFADYVLVGTKQGPVFVADDPHNLVAVAWKSPDTFRFLSEAEASSVYEKISILTNSGSGQLHRRPTIPKKQR
ncbi:MAG TPA: hypothetical protein VFA65_23410, partial [Bryobacteraceae bacterium]|nr:hypothetical protein [Bryobacteraceae bacterium]